MSEQLARLAAEIRRETGIAVKDAQLSALAAALDRAAPGLGADGFLAELNKGPGRTALLSRLIDEVTIQETYFFREARELETVDWRLLHEAARERGLDAVRVWVAACATGEEAYSLAILATEAFGTERPPVTILATDISDAALMRSAEGRYSPRSVRGVSPDRLERHFVAEGRGRYRLRQSVKSLVRFRHHNLVTHPSPPPGEVPFDLITCRNVLIYFDGTTVERVIESLESSLTPPGQLILGAADRLTGTARSLALVGAEEPEPPLGRWRPQQVNRRLRRPLGIEPPVPIHPVAERVERALRAADVGDLEEAITISADVLADDPLNADAYFIHGMAELGLGNASSAVESFRRALYVDPAFGLAAFKLGRAHDTRGDVSAARRSYERALRTLDPADDRHHVVLDKVDIGDIAAACRMRLQSGEGASA
jgi:chemotaxis methyl-accepting protein methylase